MVIIGPYNNGLSQSFPLHKGQNGPTIWRDSDSQVHRLFSSSTSSVTVNFCPGLSGCTLVNTKLTPRSVWCMFGRARSTVKWMVGALQLRAHLLLQNWGPCTSQTVSFVLVGPPCTIMMVIAGSLRNDFGITTSTVCFSSSNPPNWQHWPQVGNTWYNSLFCGVAYTAVILCLLRTTAKYERNERIDRPGKAVTNDGRAVTNDVSGGGKGDGETAYFKEELQFLMTTHFLGTS